MNIDGSDQRQITRIEGGYARFVTPDGSWLYYRGGFTNSFRKVATDGTEEQSAAEIDRFAGSFSPDGRLLAYFDDETAGSRRIKIGVRNLADQALVQMIEPIHIKAEPLYLQWSSDSRSILFVVRDAGAHLLWRSPLDGSKAQFVTDLGVEPVQRIAESPDGLSIAAVQGKWLHDAYLITGLSK
jgi:Tol biopolymer transport system component